LDWSTFLEYFNFSGPPEAVGLREEDERIEASWLSFRNKKNCDFFSVAICNLPKTKPKNIFFSYFRI